MASDFVPDDDGDLAAVPTSSVHQVPNQAVHALMDGVAETLTAVFGVEVRSAKSRSRSFVEAVMADATREEGLCFLHLTPLQIAADIADAANRELTDEEAGRYRAMGTSDFDVPGFPRYA